MKKFSQIMESKQHRELIFTNISIVKDILLNEVLIKYDDEDKKEQLGERINKLSDMAVLNILYESKDLFKKFIIELDKKIKEKS